jgi:hypothetical protein
MERMHRCLYLFLQCVRTGTTAVTPEVLATQLEPGLKAIPFLPQNYGTKRT